jgi:hypothetical protein
VRVLGGSQAITSATLRRGGVLYATSPPGTLPAGKPLVLKLRKATPGGRYTLTVISGGRAHRQTVLLTR